MHLFSQTLHVSNIWPSSESLRRFLSRWPLALSFSEGIWLLPLLGSLTRSPRVFPLGRALVYSYTRSNPRSPVLVYYSPARFSYVSPLEKLAILAYLKAGLLSLEALSLPRILAICTSPSKIRSFWWFPYREPLSLQMIIHSGNSAYCNIQYVYDRALIHPQLQSYLQCSCRRYAIRCRQTVKKDEIRMSSLHYGLLLWVSHKVLCLTIVISVGANGMCC
jgi:hypothetical protein